jgi:hypothetical protein
MVRVKNKPQHLVFCSHFPHQPFKHRHLPVETSNRPCPTRLSAVKFAPNSGQQQGGSNVPIPQFDPCPNPSPARTPAQDAEPVHFRGRSVQVVDIWTGPSRICLRFQSATWPEASAGAELSRSESRPVGKGRRPHASQTQNVEDRAEWHRISDLGKGSLPAVQSNREDLENIVLPGPFPMSSWCNG